MKVPFVDYNLFNTVISKGVDLEITDTWTLTGKSVILTKSRSSVIVKPFVGKVISIYQGKGTKRIYIKDKMIGHHLGEFALTKKLGRSIHNSERNRKKKEKMRRKITQKKVRKPKTKKVKKVKKLKK